MYIYIYTRMYIYIYTYVYVYIYICIVSCYNSKESLQILGFAIPKKEHITKHIKYHIYIYYSYYMFPKSKIVPIQYPGEA